MAPLDTTRACWKDPTLVKYFLDLCLDQKIKTYWEKGGGGGGGGGACILNHGIKFQNLLKRTKILSSLKSN